VNENSFSSYYNKYEKGSIMKLFYLISLFVLLLYSSIDAQQKTAYLTGPWLGQKTPGPTPEVFAPGIISTDAHEFSCCFSPDGNEFYFARMNPDERQNYIMCTRLIAGTWTEPEIAPFAGPFTFEPFITPDNKRIYFQTGKVVEGQLLMYTMYADRTDNGWREVTDPGESFNPMKTMHISATSDGTIYTTDISGGMGTEALGIIRKENDVYQKLEKLSSPLNNEKLSQHPWIAPDESYIVFTVRRPEQQPASVLFCSFRDTDGRWSEPREIKLDINNPGQPFITSDGKYLFFTSIENQQGDIYWVSTKIIDKLKTEGKVD
jgi:Tol biopolymer transport system component